MCKILYASKLRFIYLNGADLEFKEYSKARIHTYKIPKYYQIGVLQIMSINSKIAWRYGPADLCFTVLQLELRIKIKFWGLSFNMHHGPFCEN